MSIDERTKSRTIIQNVRGADLPPDWAQKAGILPDQEVDIVIQDRKVALQQLKKQMAQMGEEAKRNGLTEEKLQELLEENGDELLRDMYQAWKDKLIERQKIRTEWQDTKDLVDEAIAEAKQEPRPPVEEDLAALDRFARKLATSAKELNITTEEDVVQLIKEQRRRRRDAFSSSF
jgi:hypothetical protein